MVFSFLFVLMFLENRLSWPALVTFWVYMRHSYVKKCSSSKYQNQIDSLFCLNWGRKNPLKPYPAYLLATILQQLIHDQRLAMEWVKDKTANFGGDPNSIPYLAKALEVQAFLRIQYWRKPEILRYSYMAKWKHIYGVDDYEGCSNQRLVKMVSWKN